MDSLEQLKIRHKLLKDLVEDTEKLNKLHFDMDHDLLVTLKKEKLRIKDRIQEMENERKDYEILHKNIDHELDESDDS
jgi:hypothetical protein